MGYQAVQLRSIVLLVALLTSCGHSRGESDAYQKTSSNVNRSDVRSEKYGSQDVAMLCNRVSEINVLPMKGERGEDSTYDACIDAGYAVVPCLIDKVTDTTTMRDPRSEPGFPDVEVTVGDIAFFLLVDIIKINFTEPLPSDVRKQYEESGVYAYFKFVKNPGNRKKLQDNLRAWYQKHHKGQG